MPKLTEKQKRFCEEYLIDLNATQSYLRAGYKAKSNDIARVESHKLLTKPNIQEYIESLQLEQSQRTEITADKVLKELACIAFADRTDFAKVNDKGYVVLTPTDKLKDDTKKAIAGIKKGKAVTEVVSYDKIRALELLGKHLGMFTDKVSVTTEEELPKLLDALKEDK